MQDLPIKIVDFAGIDRARIRQALELLQVGPKPSQIEEMRLLLTPLPDDKHELWEAVAQTIAVDWESSVQSMEDTLKALRKRYLSACHSMKRVIQLQMLVATRGLDAHPGWWDMPCECNACASYL